MKKAYTTQTGTNVNITRTNIKIDDGLESRLDGCIDDLADKGYKTINVRLYKDPKNITCYHIKAEKGTKILDMEVACFSSYVHLVSYKHTKKKPSMGGLSMRERVKLLAGPSHEEFKKRVKNL